MSKEQQELLDEAYKNYVNNRPSQFYGPYYTQEEFINKCKTDTEFSEKWGLKIDERELNVDERISIYEKEYTNGIEVPNNNWLNSKLTTRNIPTKLITITRNGKTIESYE